MSHMTIIIVTKCDKFIISFTVIILCNTKKDIKDFRIDNIIIVWL